MFIFSLYWFIKLNIIFTYIYIFLKTPFKNTPKKLFLNFSKNNFKQPGFFKIVENSFLEKFKIFSFSKLVYLIFSVFTLNKNILFLDFNVNYNYLPVCNNFLFSRSPKELSKLIKFFDIAAIFYMNINKKKFILKKFFNLKLINVAVSDNFSKNKFDINLNTKSNNLTNYIIYIILLQIYIKVKK